MKLTVLRPNFTSVEIGYKTTLFFSYSTLVALATTSGHYRTDTKWSATTSRHMKEFGLLGELYKPVPQAELELMVAKRFDEDRVPFQNL